MESTEHPLSEAEVLALNNFALTRENLQLRSAMLGADEREFQLRILRRLNVSEGRLEVDLARGVVKIITRKEGL